MEPHAARISQMVFPSLGRDMELLLFGHAGVPVVVFPSSQGRFYEFEERGMVGCVSDKIERGEIQLYCVDSVDSESWYNRHVPPRWRIARQLQYQDYIMNEVLPLVQQRNWSPHRITLGCSFGGYHAVNLGAEISRPLYRLPVDERRIRYLGFPAGLPRPGCLLQHAAAIHRQHR